MHDNLRKDIYKALALSPTKREIINQKPEMIKSKKFIKGLMNELRNTLGILSLSERNDSILMWSHYANSHKGFCIGFGNNLDVKVSDVREVIYAEVRNTKFLFDFLTNSDPTLENFEEALRREYFLTKYIDWKYEKEWRIVGPSRTVRVYSDKCIDTVI